MPLVDLVMPKMGESIVEATILKWLKQPGDSVKMDETVLEIATDKVDSEVPSTTAGTIEEILFKVNDVVPIGTVIARIRTGATEGVGSNISTPGPDLHKNAQPATDEIHYVETTPYNTQPPVTRVTQNNPGQSNNARFYSPLVLNIAASEGVSMTELEN